MLYRIDLIEITVYVLTMVDWESQRRVLLACAECGAIYVGVELQNGEIKPIGTVSECNECSTSEFNVV